MPYGAWTPSCLASHPATAQAISDVSPTVRHMVKLVFCLHRLPNLTLPEFQTYWHETHGPLVARHADTLRIGRYVQTHTVDVPVNAALQATRGGPEPYDGVAEIWWDSVDDLVAGTATAEGQRAARELLDDERRFIDLARSPLWLAEEHPLV
jgi:uncharacterized protein (TIGR02118 family)